VDQTDIEFTHSRGRSVTTRAPLSAVAATRRRYTNGARRACSCAPSVERAKRGGPAAADETARVGRWASDHDGAGVQGRLGMKVAAFNGNPTVEARPVVSRWGDELGRRGAALDRRGWASKAGGSGDAIHQKHDRTTR